MNRTSTSSAQYLRPAASIIENKEGFLIEADLPGVTLDGVRLNVEKNILTIEGKRRPAPGGDGNGQPARRPLYIESSSLDYRRAFELGREIDTQHVTAKFNQGVLQVFLPKAEAAKPRRVQVAG